jgi:dipeptidyl aminopeptidase/acylaminoacyl peptidase
MVYRPARFVVTASIVIALSGLLAPENAPAQEPKTPFTLGTAFNEPFVYGTRPSFRGFSPDEKKLFFTWNDSSFSKTVPWQHDLKTGQQFKVATGEDLSANLSPDLKRRLTLKDGDLWITDIATGQTRRLTRTPSREGNPVFSSDGKKIAYSFEGNIWVMDLDAAGITQVTKKSADEPDWQLAGWAANDKGLLLTQSDSKGQKDLYFPEYNGKFVDPGKSQRGLIKTTAWFVWVDSTKPRKLFEGEIWLRSLSASPDGQTIVADIIDPAMKLRDIHRYSVNGTPLKPQFHDSTGGWINFGYAASAFAPKADRFVFASEKSGWNHLYLSEKGGEPVQITSGNWELNWWRWVDDQTIVYLGNEADPGEYHLYLLDVAKRTTVKLTSAEAYRYDPAISPSKRYIVFSRSGWNEPGELYMIDLKGDRKEVRLTKSVPAAFASYDWIKPEYIRFTSRDNTTKINMTVVRKPSAEKQPVVVFIHGAGSLQNVYKGWSESYYREYVFHQYLAQKGYTVIEVDYRHSLGYGRKFREDVTGWMGRYELEDIEDGLREIDKRNYADLSRVGVYGGSYGGFLTLYAVTHSPDYFHAGAALRAVTNWENYYHANMWYTLPRLGKPDTERENYVRSSPLYHVNKLTRPVLLLHGLIDNNVGFQDAAQYVEKLIQQRKQPFDMMMYPTERHSFVDQDAWFDEYARIEAFFDKYVKNKVKE